ncbi:helix-turn-helix transcriptional regulator [Oceanobacillus kimchii]|uniref:helix-turn-helix transcriptional regulator n=1 Tax=Oceanobacillus kimchii TaxID=746691 RepID=UPI000344CCA7|nr:DeoR family transcriptional regulator [Oceanobacillus kimchii]
MKKQTPVKEQLLELLKKNHELSIDEIMQHFSISEIAIRKHLKGLVSQKFVNIIQHKQEIGRPYHTYQLAEKGHEYFPNQYQQLSVQLLEDIEDIYGKDAVNAILKKQIDRFEQMLKNDLGKTKTEEKLHIFMEKQNKKGYMFERFISTDGSTLLINYHCPFKEAAVKYPSICKHEERMLSDLFSEGKITVHSLITDGGICCKWKINISNT